MKVKVSFDGRQNNETWEVDQTDTIGTPHLVISRGQNSMQVTFESQQEIYRFQTGIGLCRAKDEKGKEIYLTGFVKKAS